jgi:preprotein translocase subunit SecE
MKNVLSFLKEVKLEFSKIVWPTKKEFIGSTLIILFVILLFTIFLGFINFMFHIIAQKGFEFLI